MHVRSQESKIKGYARWEGPGCSPQIKGVTPAATDCHLAGWWALFAMGNHCELVAAA